VGVLTKDSTAVKPALEPTRPPGSETSGGASSAVLTDDSFGDKASMSSHVPLRISHDEYSGSGRRR
jgi:hypothetical protein